VIRRLLSRTFRAKSTAPVATSTGDPHIRRPAPAREIDAGLRRLRLRGARRSRPCCKCRGVLRTGRGTENIDLAFRSDRSVSVSGDPVLLAQALSNLIDNALKYAPVNGSIEVAVVRRSDGTAQVSGVGRWPGNRRFGKVQSSGTLLSRRCEPRHSGRRLRVESRAGGGKLHGSALELSGQEPGPARCDPLPFDAASLVALAAPQQETRPGR